MKIRTLIADDEFFIRKKLIKIITDGAPFVDIIGEAENGQELIKLIDKNKVDLIIMDIKMPLCTGLEVAQYIYDAGLDIKMIIISGYNDFEYARSALRFGVSEYLSKPIPPNQLLLSLNKIKESIELEYITKHSKRIYLLLQVLKSQIDKYDYIKLLNHQNKQINYQFISIYFDGADNEFLYTLTSYIESFNLQLEYIRESDNIISLFIHAGKSILKDKLFIDNIIRTFFSSYNNYYFVIISEIFNENTNWREIYLHTLISLNYRFFNNVKSISFAEMHEYYNSNDISEIKSQLNTFIKSRNFSGLEAYINYYMNNAKSNNDIHLMQNFIREFFSFLDMNFHILGNLSMSEYIKDFLDEEFNMEELKNSLYKLCMSYLKISSEGEASDIIVCNKVIQLISNNYQNPEFGVGNIAEELNLNASYLGSIFKRVWKISMLKYLNRVRLNKAKELLSNTGLKIADVAISCGYTDTFYFSKKYKDMFGYSPNKEKLKSH